MLKKCFWPFILMAMLLLVSSAAAQSVTVDVNEVQSALPLDAAYVETHLTQAAQYVNLVYDVGEDAKPVSLVVTHDETGTSVYEKRYEAVSGQFVSDAVYLKYTGSAPDRYTFTLTVDGDTISFPFHRKLMYLTDNGACSYGVRFGNMGLRNDWMMGTALDLTRLASGETVSVPLVASNMYRIGQMTAKVSGGQLTVSAAFSCEVNVHSQALYVLSDMSEIVDLSDKRLRVFPTYASDQPIDIQTQLGGASYAVVFFKMTIDYDPNGLDQFDYYEDADQLRIWHEMEQTVQTEPVG